MLLEKQYDRPKKLYCNQEVVQRQLTMTSKITLQSVTRKGLNWSIRVSELSRSGPTESYKSCLVVQKVPGSTPRHQTADSGFDVVKTSVEWLLTRRMNNDIASNCKLRDVGWSAGHRGQITAIR